MGRKNFKLDIRDGCYLIFVKEGDEWQTAFRTRDGLYEYMGMPFRLAVTLATFQNMMNVVLREFLDQVVVGGLDDNHIYSGSQMEHEILVAKVLQWLQDEGVAVSPKKTGIRVMEVEFLMSVISNKA